LAQDAPAHRQPRAAG